MANKKLALAETIIKKVTFKTIGRGMQCGWTDHSGILVRDDKKLEWLWDKFYSHSLYPPPLPEINFEENMWICTFRGQFPTWGYSIEIRKIEEWKDAHNTFLRVHVLQLNPSRFKYLSDKLEFAQPFHIVEMPQSNRQLRFRYRERTKW